MLKFYIATIANAMNLFLLVGATSALYRLKRSQSRDRHLRYVYLISFILAVINAYVRYVPNLVHRASLSFYSAFPLLLASLFLLFSMFRYAPEKGEARHKRYFAPCLFFFIISAVFYYLPKVLLLITQFSSYGEVYTFTDMSLRVMGYLLGLFVMCISAYIVFRGAIALDYEMCRIFILAAIIVFDIPVVNDIILRLYQLKIIPKNPFIFKTIAFVSNNASLFIYLIMIALCGLPLMMLIVQKRMPMTFSNPAEARKLRALKRRMRRTASAIVASFFVVFMTLGVIKALHEREIPLSPPEEYEFKDGEALIPLSLLEDGHLHRFSYKSKDGYDVSFICLEKNKGNFAACYDACEICGAAGYLERKDEVVCKLCDVVMNRGTIGFKGGCNPIPKKFTVDSEYLRITQEDLETEAYRFR